MQRTMREFEMRTSGQVITFYSYKGGAGRSMALANMAVLLAKWGYKTLIADWDLDAPGLENHFKNYGDKRQFTYAKGERELDFREVPSEKGLVELLLGLFGKSGNYELMGESEHWQNYVISIKLIQSIGGSFDLITAGERSDGYFSHVEDLNDKLRKGTGSIEYLREEWKKKYDLILIDSRTGVTDIGGICTIQMPDILLFFLTSTFQALEGTKDIARRIKRAREESPWDRYKLITVPVASRFGDWDTQQTDEWLRRCAEVLQDLYDAWLPYMDMQSRDEETRTRDVLEILRLTKIPYRPWYSFGEKLAVIEEDGVDPVSLSYAYHTLTALIANGPGNVLQLRSNRSEFVRRASRVTPAENVGARREWVPLGGPFVGSPSVAVNFDQRLEVFIRSTDNGNLWHHWQRTPKEDIWYSSSLGGDVYDPQVIANADGRLEVFARGSEGDLRHIWQTAQNSSESWSEWVSLGGLVQGPPAVAVNADGRLEVFVRSTFGRLHHICQNEPGSESWSKWVSYEAPSREPYPSTELLAGINYPQTAVNADGRLEVFVLGSDGRLWHICQTAVCSDSWGEWQSLGGILQSPPAVGKNADGRIQVFVRGTDGRLYYTQQSQANSLNWNKWYPLEGPRHYAFTPETDYRKTQQTHGIVQGINLPQVITNHNGELEVFARGDDGALWHIRQSKPNAEQWGDWFPLGGVLDGSPALGLDADSRIVVFVRGTDNMLWRRFIE
jgi:cellulose biosynthesis protein BcsQ